MEQFGKILGIYSEDGKALIMKAVEFAAEALAGKTRGNGSPFIEHPLGVARIAAAEIGLSAECIAAVFLHEATRTGNVQVPAGMFGRDILTLVDGLNKISTIKPKDTRLEAENYKKLIISYSTDPRVMVLKLADRLEVMRSIELFPKATRERKALETLMLYIPLAHQLGLYNMKSEMEDIYFRYAEPEQHRAITNRLKAGEADRQKITTDFIEPLKAKLLEAGISYKDKARTKTSFSIWKKMQQQKVGFDGVFDVFAMRFIIDAEKSHPLIGDDGKMLEGLELERALCWKVFSYVTEHYESDTKRLRDWITNPKPNGYEALHITVKNEDGAFLEVQIRTRRMDDLAENGLASHWSYKGIKRENTLTDWLNAVRHSLEHGDTASLSPSDHEGDDELPRPTTSDIFVFTPTGELRKLPAGATVLDFAFDIHTGLGCKCTGGRVNGKAVPIRERLKTGDYVEIITGKNQKPSADWLNFVVSGKARTKIRQKLKEVEFAKAAEGRELLERRLKNWKLELPDELMAEFLKDSGYRSANAFHEALGRGEYDVANLKEYIIARQSSEKAPGKEEADPGRSAWTGIGKGADDILVIDARNVKNIDYRMSKCCNPVFGDDVFGFVTRTEGIKIHRISCPNASRLLERYPYRIQKVRWSSSPSTSSFQSSLKIVAAQEPSVINEIMTVTTMFKASIRGFNVSDDDRHGTYDITMKLSIPSNMELDKIISQLKLIRNVSKVSRI